MAWPTINYFVDGQSATISFIIDAINSFPLSDCKIVGAPNCIKILNRKPATYFASLEVSGQAHENQAK